MLQNAEEFASELAAAGDKLLVVDFVASWCGPCKMMAPKLEALAAENTEAVFVKIDIVDNEDIADAHKIESLPTVVLFKNGAEITRIKGTNMTAIETAVAINA